MRAFLLLFCAGLFSSFSTVAYNVVVAADGSGDVKTVQAAFDKVPNNNTSTFTIFVKKGTYKEKLRLTSLKKNVSLSGESKTETILTYDDYGSKSGVGGTDYSYSTLIEADNFYAENITFENTIDSRLAAYSSGGQAVALMVNADKIIFFNCIIRGFQDTFYTKGLGRIYVSCCQIEGTTDFIFGAGIALFENCLIINKKNSHTTAAANTSQANKYNYVFLRCKLIAAEGANSVTLGRPWKLYAKVVYLYCEEGAHIKAEGWSDWSSASYASTAYFAEYKCTGAGYQPSSRLSWTYQLTDTQAAEYTMAKIFAASAASPAYSSSWAPAVQNLTCNSVITEVSDDLLKETPLSTSPNPASTHVDFQFSANSADKATLKVYNTEGLLILEQQNDILLGNNKISMNTEHLKAGTYLYSILLKDQTLNGRFMIVGN